MRAHGRRMLRILTFFCLGALSATALAQRQLTEAECPQPRFTGKAPAAYYGRTNPLEANAENLGAGRRLYLGRPREASCAACHGEAGGGNGPLASMFTPRPRNFACRQTVNGIPDGQLFWIIRYGSPGTSMPDHPALSDAQIWQVVLHLRRLAR
jgi:mono/diheme cytochrome c family protein